MKILIVSVITPFPIDTGGNAGTFKLINLARNHNEITFISLPSSKSKIDGLKKEWPNVKVLTKVEEQNEPTTKEKLKKGVKNLIQKKQIPSKLLLDRTNLVDGFYEDFVDDVVKLTNSEKFDLIQVEYIELAAIVYFLPTQTPKVFVHHELRYRRMEYEYGLMKEQSHSNFWKIQTTKELEVGLMNRYNKVFTVSEDDKNYLIESGVAVSKVAYSPSPVEFVKRKTNQPFVFANKIVYLGPEAHYPNEDGVRWFLDECWQAINQKFPILEFQIVGKWSTETIATLPQHKNVKFLGFVDDLEEVFSGAILVVPLRIGGGMRMKILEAISWNTPIITTTIGAEGLPMQHKKNCYLADNAQQFNDAINDLIHNDELVLNLIREGHAILGERFSIENCGKKRQDLYQEVINNS